MSATRPECSSGTDHVNRHAEDEDPRAAVRNYVPYAIPKDEWAPVADFTRESVLMVHPRSERHAIEAMRTISQFVAWAHREGYPLDRDRMFTPDAVERYVATAATHLAVSSRATRRSDLRRFSRQITTKAPWPPDAPQLKQRRTLVPFTEDEITRLWEVANTQSTAIRRRRFTGYLALGLGAGLHPHEMWKANAGDLETVHGFLCVRVAESRHPRVVPITAPNDEILAVFLNEPQDAPILAYRPRKWDRSPFHEMLRKADVPPGCPTITPARLRATWMVAHLSAGISMGGLMQIAGFTSWRPYQPLQQFVAQPDEPTLFAQAVRR